jgi:hypothetical protein
MRALELIRRLIRQGSNNIGEPVKNLYGAVAGPLAGIVSDSGSSWMHLAIPGTTLITPTDFYQVFFTDPSAPLDLLDVIDGVMTYTGTSNQLRLFRTTLDVASDLVLPLTVNSFSSQAKFAVYVDGTLQRKGQGKLLVPIALDKGRHHLEVVASTASMTLTTPASIHLDGTLELPAKPQWENVTSGYLDPIAGTCSDILTWYVDARVGGWRVLRRVTTPMDVILSVGDANHSGVYGITIQGAWETKVSLGAEILAGTTNIGTLISVVSDTNTATSSFLLRLPPSLHAPDPAWVGVGARLGSFTELTQVKRTTSAGLVTWTDHNVRIGQSYEYALQAFGLFDNSLVGPLSDIWYIRAGDLQAPGPIVFASGYPQTVGDNILVKFHTPIDDDYAGVNVYFREQELYVVADVLVSGVQLSGPFEIDHYSGWLVVPENGPASGERHFIIGNTIDALEFSDDWLLVPDAGDTLALFMDHPLKTDYGLPDTDDELTCSMYRIGQSVGTGNYYFRSFDKSRNEQADPFAVLWPFDAALANVIGELSYTLIAANTLQVVIGDLGSAVVAWDSYERKGSWPTLEGTPFGTLMQDYLRYEGDLTALSYQHAAEDGLWFCIVVPLNGAEEEGPRITAQLDVAGAPTVAALSGVSIAAVDDPLSSMWNNKLSWTHDASIPEDSTNFTVRIFMYTDAGGPETETEVTLTPYNATWDSGSITLGASNSLPGVGSYLDRHIGAVRPTGTTWRYTVKLYDGATLIGSYPVSISTGDSLPGSNAPTISGVSLDVTPATLDPLQYPDKVCQTMQINDVSWEVANPDNTNYSIMVKSTSGRLVANGIPCAAGNRSELVPFFQDPSGVSKQWQYTVFLVKRSDFSIVQSVDSNIYFGKFLPCGA